MAGVRTLVMGVGINDVDYKIVDRSNGYKCPYYIKWASMLRRCLSEKVHLLQPTYSETSIIPEWLRLSNFRAWMMAQDWRGKELDKDLLGNGSIYSPETCCFIHKEVNTFMTDRRNYRGLLPIGVTLYPRNGTYKSQISNLNGRRIVLGYFKTPEEAWSAWAERKRELATILAQKQDDFRIALALMNRYDFCNLSKLSDGTWNIIYGRTDDSTTNP